MHLLSSCLKGTLTLEHQFWSCCTVRVKRIDMAIEKNFNLFTAMIPIVYLPKAGERLATKQDYL